MRIPIKARSRYIALDLQGDRLLILTNSSKSSQPTIDQLQFEAVGGKG